MRSNIILIGMPATGKSTVGVILAKRLGMDFADTDLLICKRAKATLPDIINSEGLDGLMRHEEAVGRSLQLKNCVIATGGSMVLYEDAMQSLAQSGTIIWLNTELEQLIERLPADLHERGIVCPEGQGPTELFAQRLPLYMKYSDITINCHGSTEEVVEAILTALHSA